MYICVVNAETELFLHLSMSWSIFGPWWMVSSMLPDAKPHIPSFVLSRWCTPSPFRDGGVPGIKFGFVKQNKQSKVSNNIQWFNNNHMGDGRNYLFGEYAITKSGWSPIGYEAFGFATSTSKQNHTIYIVASWDLHMCRKMQIWFCSSFLFTTLTISAPENI